VAARLVSALLLLCLSPLAPALELFAVSQPAMKCSCCSGMKTCCCRHSAGKPGWNPAPQCNGSCHGTPFAFSGLAFTAPNGERARLEPVLAPHLIALETRPRGTFLHSPLLQRPPPSLLR